ncbi:MAG: septum formation protein Maf [Elusimicrobia bacterium RIFOXYB2_FULL_49_7]|nr:MAG: septum formation protein Maf [Elusimicrobia bacterium RIFOXYB2_FULL_49_7]
MKSVILASASPRRRELLKSCGLRFSIMPGNVDEDSSLKKPSFIVRELAARKAMAVAKQARRGIVIGADTIVVFRGSIIGKPEDERDAMRILSLLNGTFHRVYSGIAVVDAGSGRMKTDYDVSAVKMRALSKDEIKRFSKKHLDKAGAYAVQETGDAFVERIEGDYFNVVGLPLGKLRKLLKSFGIVLDKHR